eukprot:scaffold586340_cov16-Prasinocladus_malaysianus.AAC.1
MGREILSPVPLAERLAWKQLLGAASEQAGRQRLADRLPLAVKCGPEQPMGRVLLADADEVGSFGAPGHHLGPETVVETSALPL